MCLLKFFSSLAVWGLMVESFSYALHQSRDQMNKMCMEDTSSMGAGMMEMCARARCMAPMKKALESSRAEKAEKMTRFLGYIETCKEMLSLTDIPMLLPTPMLGRRPTIGGGGGLFPGVDFEFPPLRGSMFPREESSPQNDQTVKDFKCCIAQQKGDLDSSNKLMRDEMMDQYRTMFSEDPGALEGIIAGFDTCESPEEKCDIPRFKRCLMDSCVDAMKII